MSNKKLIQEDYMQIASKTFIDIIKDVYGTDNFADVAPKIYDDRKNIIGEGNTKLVFKIAGAEGFVLALLKDEFDSSKPLSPFRVCKIPLPKYNFGQTLFENDNGLMIMRKSEGVPHSLLPWIKYCFGVLGESASISKEAAENALLKICEIARMPQETFNHMAMQIKYLNENSLPIDTVNPNNLLIDKENKQINLIDVFDGPKFLQKLQSPMNGVRNMEAVLLDSILHTEYMKVLSPGFQELMKFASGIVIDKCQKAGENVGLVNDSDNVRHYFELIVKNNKRKSSIPTLFLRRYEEFEKLYKNKLDKERLIKLNPELNAEYERQEFDYLQFKKNMLQNEFGDKMGNTADVKMGKITPIHTEAAKKHIFLAKELMKIRNEK